METSSSSFTWLHDDVPGTDDLLKIKVWIKKKQNKNKTY